MFSYCVCQFYSVAYILCFLSNIGSYCGCPFYVIGYAARFVNFLPACRTNHRLTDGLITDQTTFKARKLFLPFPNGVMQYSFMIWSYHQTRFHLVQPFPLLKLEASSFVTHQLSIVH